MRLTKIYTKTGDKGQTSLADGSKVSKADLRIDTYGHVDELNSYVGLLRDELPDGDEMSRWDEKLYLIQNELFDIGGELATPSESLNHEAAYLIRETSITRLEKEIDEMNDQLEPLKNFVLPGGHRSNSQAHVCRTVTRRCERAVHKLSEEFAVRPEIVKYLNRLSDWFFVFSRHVSRELNVSEVIWQQKKT